MQDEVCRWCGCGKGSKDARGCCSAAVASTVTALKTLGSSCGPKVDVCAAEKFRSATAH